jgi:diguanylate cyclase (GGDEF)-like protein/PAS domain S-box-containing protein
MAQNLAVGLVPQSAALRHARPAPRRMSARTAVFALFLAYGLVGLGLGLYAIWADRQSVIASTERTTADLSRLLEDHFLNALRATDVALARVTDAMARGEPARGEPDKAVGAGGDMIRSMGSSPHIASLFLVDADGKVTVAPGAGPASAPAPAPAPPVDGRDFFLALKAGAPDTIGQVTRDPWTGAYVFPVARRLVSPSGEFAGAVVANIQVSFFKALYHGLNLGSAPGLGVYRLDGTILVREPLPEADIGRNMSKSPVFTTYLPQSAIGTYHGRSAYDGVERIVSYRKVDSPPLLVWVALSQDDALTDWWWRAVQTAILTLVGLTLTSWLASRALRAIERERTAEEQLFLEKEQADITLLSIADGVLTTDAQGRVRYANPAARRLLNRSPGDLEGQLAASVLPLMNEALHTPLADPVAACLEAGRHVDANDDAILLRADGVEVAVEVSATPMHNRRGDVTGTVVAVRDVAQERRLHRMLEHQAAHDPLTGLLNRRAFEQRLRQALSETKDGESAWLCYVDLDQFKLINDTCGHLAGDELLKQVARQLRAGAREGDVVARMGGDEFGVLFSHSTRNMAYEMAEKIRRRLSELRFAWGSQSFTTSGSFGLVPIQERSGSLYDLLSAADRACYVAKNRGRNRIHLAEALDEATSAFGGEMRWAHATIHALEQDRLMLYGQPIRPLRPGAGGMHMEILVRMRGDDNSVVSPGAFIPAAERYNLMNRLDGWVVHHAINAFAGTPAGTGTVAVNLSAQSLCDDEFLGFVLAEIDESGIAPSVLCFEITETAAMTNLTRAQDVIRTLKGRGCRFALDDFGSGLSSFAYLKSLPVDFLKIDGSFVRHIAESTLDRAFVQSINDIGHLMGIETIAEYVESDEIVAVLREIGVDYAQGYAIGKPAPLATLVKAPAV